MPIDGAVLRLRQKIAAHPQWLAASFIALTTFGVYTCMYGYRKAFTAATFSGISFLGIHYKVWLVTAQVLGYMGSKFYGIRFISEAKEKGKPTLIFRLIVLAWIALLGFALLPAPWNIIMMVLNGFPLGMIWGLVYGYVEGRRSTEFIGAVLASSFIFASGFAKTIGSWLMIDLGVSEQWMPFAAGALYLLPLLLLTRLLAAIPAPDNTDQALRSRRNPMDRAQRKAFLKRFAPGLLLLIPAYVLLTTLRDFRDNFSSEILADAGLGGQAGIFARMETPVALLVLLGMALLVLVKNNFRAFVLSHWVVVLGFGLAAASTWLYSSGYLSAYYWFLLVGIGLYLSYIPINTIYFERMIASFRMAANVGFLMYIADSFGYLGSVGVLVLREFAGVQLSWLQFFRYIVYIGSGAGAVLVLLALYVFYRQYNRVSTQQT